MFQAVNLGKFQFQDLANVISIAIPLAAQLGVGFKDVLAAAATLTSQGFSVAEAMTSIRASMVAIITPNKQMNELFAVLGVTSGEALIKTKGLQGALEALRTAAQGNTGALAEAMGRVEGLGAALGLTGEKATKARADLESVRGSMEGLGAATLAYNEINKSRARQFELLLTNLKATAIQMGTALLPTVNNLLAASKPLLDFLATAVQKFSELPEGLRTAALAMAGFAAVLGPVLFVAGTLISSIASVVGAFTTLSGIVTSFVGAGSLLSLSAGIGGIGIAATVAGPLAIAFGAAIAGWAIYEAVTKLKQLEAQMESTRQAFEREGVATKKQQNEISILTGLIEAHNKVLGNNQVQVNATGLTTQQYIEKLRNAVKGLGDFSVAIENTSAKTTESVKAHVDLRKELETQEKALTEIKKAYDLGAASADQLAAQQEKIYVIMRQLHPEWESTRKYSTELMQSLEGSRDAFKELGESAFKSQFQIKSWSETLGITNEQIGIFARSYPELVSALERESEALSEQNPLLKTNYANMKDLDAIIKQSQRDISQQAKSIDDLTREYGFLHDQQVLGIQDSETMARRALDVRIAYENVTRAVDGQGRAIYGLGTKRLAEIRMLQEQIREQQALGNNTTELQLKMGHLSEALARQNDGWVSTVRNMRSVASSGITQLTHDLIFQFDRLGDTAKRLGETLVTVFVDHIMQKALKPALDMMDNLIAKVGTFITDALGLGGGKGGILGTSVGAAGGAAGTLGKAGSGIGAAASGLDNTLGAASSATSLAASGVAGIVGAAAGVVSAVSDVISNFQLARQEGTLNAIEQHTKVMAIVLAGISAPWEKAAEGQDTLFEAIKVARNVLVDKLPWVVDFTHQTASSLKDFIQPNVALITASIKAIEQQIVSTPQVQQAASSNTVASSVTINVNGAGDPATIAKNIMDLLKAQSPVFV